MSHPQTYSAHILTVTSASKIFHTDHGYESTVKAVDESLQRFGFGGFLLLVSSSFAVLTFPVTDYIDLYLIHSPRSGKELRLDTWRALLDLQKTGKVHTVGVSN